MNETNMVICACGCGGQVRSPDRKGRPRLFVRGHNNRKPDSPVEMIECECGCGTPIRSVDEWGRKRRFVKGHSTTQTLATTDTITCACGCGKTMTRLDQWGRPRKYLNGHNGRKYEGVDATRWAVSKRYAKNHPEKIRDNKREYYRKRKLKAMAELGNQCHFCQLEYDGKNAPKFEFHHREPHEKEAGINRILTNRTWGTVQNELLKCVLVCANCHNQHHGGEW